MTQDYCFFELRGRLSMALIPSIIRLSNSPSGSRKEFALLILPTLFLLPPTGVLRKKENFLRRKYPTNIKGNRKSQVELIGMIILMKSKKALKVFEPGLLLLLSALLNDRYNLKFAFRNGALRNKTGSLPFNTSVISITFLHTC